MSQSVSFNKELKYHQFKEDVKIISEKYTKITKDLSNLSIEENNGLKTLMKKLTDNTVICYQTDKSGRWSYDTEDNYKKACRKHLNEEITLKEHGKSERETNSHCFALLRMMELKDVKNEERIRKTFALAPFYCLGIDQKK